MAVRDAVARLTERARGGEGPGLVEALTYRMSDHSTADDARKYRKDEEVSARWAEEPIAQTLMAAVRCDYAPRTRKPPFRQEPSPKRITRFRPDSWMLRTNLSA